MKTHILRFFSVLALGASFAHGAVANAAATVPTLPGQPDDYTVVQVPSDGIERYIPIGTAAQGLPERIQGIWWMDGNPLGDILLTFGNASYDAATRTAVLSLAFPGSYTFYPRFFTEDSYRDLVRSNPAMIIQFSEDFTFATITPSQDQFASLAPLFGARAGQTFTMYWVGDGHWVRESWYLGFKVADYQLRRVVRGDGKRDPAYINYVEVADEMTAIGVKKP